ncbi:metallophosphoesterase family protein [Roseateles toxinivorans]|uniref:Putative phosphodiesterase n=1 Tax=Roseateles toxinivorans TaxID=270368 RepID=A0A4R6QIY0_9BURK|nr:metallophosphoesterase family protein [Roseateles toxinivorans]TDP63077.1 putative phosphodiesterase [Roseateles toxinivorans]
MKQALITDMHANREAFEAVLEHAGAQGATQYAFLGDYVGYGADPGWVIDRVREFVAQGAMAVMGNHDAAVVQGAGSGMREDARAAVEWTRSQLKPEQLDFLAKLPMHQQRDDRLYVHANAFDPGGWEYVLGRSEAVRSLHATRQRLTFCGHMHEPMLFHLSGTGKAGDFAPVAGVPIPLLSNRQWLAIPGSVGQPRDGNPAAAYAMLDLANAELTFHRVPYNIEGAAQRIREAGLPDRLAARLFEGE